MPAADEVGRLQRGQGAECDLFRTIAEQGHYAGRTVPSDTRQGIYATTPSGILLASVNSRSAREVTSMLERALAAWEVLPRAERRMDPASLTRAPLRARWERLYPEDGLVLRVTSRDLREPSDPAAEPTRPRRRSSWKRHAWNQDYAWFRRLEMMSFVPASRRVGATTTLPESLAERVVRLHLVDNVRGQVRAFSRDEVQRAEVTSRITAIDDGRITLALSGRTRAVHAATPEPPAEEGRRRNPERAERGVETELTGRAIFDTERRRFVAFELVAIGKRWGATRYNGRERDTAAAGIGIAFTLATNDPPVAPAYIWEYGWR
ncbi:MAG: hypothetical protein KJO43_06295 [Phycisphaerae bacterium]|nr:hypothetical protein [Phycisphaerae bacterium]